MKHSRIITFRGLWSQFVIFKSAVAQVFLAFKQIMFRSTYRGFLAQFIVYI